MTLGFCLLFILAAFAIQVVLPIFLLYKLVRFLMRKFGGGQPEPKAAAGEGLKAALERSRAESGDASGAVTAAPQSEFASPAREAIFVKLKKEGRLDRLALVYYVEDALKSGLTPQAVAEALRAKGWPEADIAAVVPG